MIKKLRLERFKSFRDAELILGPLTLLVGTNASGKSNIRDAFRFLHGLSRGYNLAEILGEKWVEGGVLQWRGIRGGTLEAAYMGERTFALEVSFDIVDHGAVARGLGSAESRDAVYRIEVEVERNGKAPRVVAEKLLVRGEAIFDSHPERSPLVQDDPKRLKVRGKPVGRGRPPHLEFANSQPVLSQLVDHLRATKSMKEAARLSLNAFAAMRFLDLSPEAMHFPSLPGQTVLGDRGENLSSVLQAICEDPTLKQALIGWVQELTPMDARDFEFPADQTGKILVTLIEENGQKISANSASDGTLRFLAMIAALLGPASAPFYFFEELENGIHPTRLHLLLQLIEQRVSTGEVQMVATTHSPQLLALVSRSTLEHASLTYRLTGQSDTRIKRILDIPDARHVVGEQDVARLHASGWLEDAVELSVERYAAR
ncbi:MAG: AAA family ATPase [Chloroflexi bacterium]|nr:AAA family ATPase [Chloroflexota bacterium]